MHFDQVNDMWFGCRRPADNEIQATLNLIFHEEAVDGRGGEMTGGVQAVGLRIEAANEMTREFWNLCAILFDRASG